MSEYTHKALIAKGYMRQAPDPVRGVGFVVYSNYGVSPREVVFVGNNATMQKWTEGHWQRNFPEIYAWYTNPKSQDPHDWHGHFVFIKGEDPKLKEGQDGSESSESGVQDLHGDSGGPA